MRDILISLIVGAAIAYRFASYSSPAKRDSTTHNFSAGPAKMPDDVMAEVHQNFLNHHGSGMSFLEMSHRDVDGPVQTSLTQSERDLRTLLDIPSNYHVLFMHGGAHGQFSAVPLNLLSRSKSGEMAYVITGFWSERAAAEAEKFGKVVRIPGKKPSTSAAAGQEELLSASEWKVPANAAYVHLCASETIHGIEFLEDPELKQSGEEEGGPVLVADFTSTLLSRRVNVSRYGIIYASGGKNLGPAGFTLVIIRKDLVGPGKSHKLTPSILDYHLSASSAPIPSIYNTPPTFQIYIHSLVLRHLLNDRHGLAAVESAAIHRASLIYSVIDASDGFYSCHVAPAYRSRMSIPFRIAGGDQALEDKFLKGAEELKMLQLWGHKMVGGLRVTLYNGIATESLEKLNGYMREFQKQNQGKSGKEL